jgi:hypothetical protein
MGTRENLVFERASDIRTALGFEIFQPFKEGKAIRLAVSDKPLKGINLQTMLRSPMFRRSKMWIPIALGCDLLGEMILRIWQSFPTRFMPARHVRAKQSDFVA